jgi:hypothetical protein
MMFVNLANSSAGSAFRDVGERKLTAFQFCAISDARTLNALNGDKPVPKGFLI